MTLSHTFQIGRDEPTLGVEAVSVAAVIIRTGPAAPAVHVVDARVARLRQIADLVQVTMNQSVKVLGNNLVERSSANVAYSFADDRAGGHVTAEGDGGHGAAVVMADKCGFVGGRIISADHI